MERNIFGERDVFQAQKNTPEQSQLFQAIRNSPPEPEFIPQNPLANIYQDRLTLEPFFDPTFNKEKTMFRLNPEQSLPKQRAEYNEEERNLIGQYQRQLEKEKPENMLAKKQVLMYKEQPIREREMRLQQMTDRMSQGSVMNAPLEITQDQVHNNSNDNFEPGTENLSMGSGMQKRDNTAYMAQLMRSELKNNNLPTENFELEESLSSDTKLVKVADRPDALKDLYQTWTAEKPKEMKNKHSDPSLQTSIEAHELNELKTPKKPRPTETIPKQKAADEDEIEEDYSQIEKQTLVDFGKQTLNHIESLDYKGSELEDTVKVESVARGKVVTPRASGSVKLTDLKMARMNKAKNSTKSAATKMIEALEKDIVGIAQANKQKTESLKGNVEEERRKWTDSTDSKADYSINEGGKKN